MKPKPNARKHFNATYRNIVGNNMFHTFGYPVTTLRVVCKVEFGQIFLATFWMLYDVVLAWPPLLQHCCAGACAIVRFVILKRHPTCCNRVAKCTQHVVPNNDVAIFCVEMLTVFG